jgi:hypothetical protein
MEIIEGVKEILSRTSIQLDPDQYIIASIDLQEEKKARETLKDLDVFSSVTYDYKEISVVAKTSEWKKVRGNFYKIEEAGPYRLITFNLVLDLSIVGFMAEISKRLAEHMVSIYALSTYLRDHILVKSEDAERAVSCLEGMILEAVNEE